MPIAPEVRRFYGRDWRRFRERMIEIHGTRCTICHRDTPRYLNFAHVTHDPVTSSIARLCPGCHARHDAPRRIATLRRRRAARYGQLWLLAEIEYAAAPAWAIPRGYFEALQGGLFGNRDICVIPVVRNDAAKVARRKSARRIARGQRRLF